MEQELEENYAKWENDLDNVARLDQARRFIDNFNGKIGPYLSIFRDENYKLQKTIDDSQKNLIRLRNIPHTSEIDDARNIKFKREIEEFENIEEKFLRDKKFLDRVRNRFYQKRNEIHFRADVVYHNYQIIHDNDRKRGLSPARIQTFQLFTADETHVGSQCSICQEDVDVGRRMRRLTCDGQHYFCQECIEGWFAEHNTCPLCRHKFD